MAENWTKIAVSLRKNDLEAYVNVPFVALEGSTEGAITVDNVRKALKAHNVVNGLLMSEVERIFRESLYDQDVLVASGIPPKDGDNGGLEFYFETETGFRPAEDADGRIDYRESTVLVNVEKGAHLCRRIPPTKGAAGTTVTGKSIQANEGRDTVLPKGLNTEVSPNDPDLLLASTSGCVSLNSSKVVEVKPKLEIKGDVDFSTGNIDFVGSLMVVGDIKTGFKVKVGGDLEVNGVVEDAEVEVGGDALLKKGFSGQGKGRIKTEGNLTAKYIQGQTIICNGNLNVGGELMHCNAKVKGNVTVTGKKGAIIGGKWQVRGSVEAPQIGSISYTQTEIAVGCNFELLARMVEIEDELKKIEGNQKKIKDALYNLSRLKIKLKGTLPAEQQQLYDRLQETSKHFPVYKEELEKELEELKNKTEEHKNSYVKVGKTLFPGVRIIIGKFTRVFNEQTERTTLREVRGEIVGTV